MIEFVLFSMQCNVIKLLSTLKDGILKLIKPTTFFNAKTNFNIVSSICQACFNISKICLLDCKNANLHFAISFV